MLDEALALVVAATGSCFARHGAGGREVVAGEEFGLLPAGRRCLGRRTLLIDAGAVEAVPLDDAGEVGPGVWLQRAAAALDAITVGQRPVLLTPAPVQLAAVLVTVPA